MIFIPFKFLPKWVRGLTFYPFILLAKKSDKNDVVFVNHEKIHLRQQIELLLIVFYLWYVVEFLVKWGIYRSWMLAYRNISFEREAYLYEKDLNYLKKRSFWSFIKFV